MIVNVPECFTHNPNATSLKETNLMYYFNSFKFKKANIHLSKHFFIYIFKGKKVFRDEDQEYIINEKECAFILKDEYIQSQTISEDNFDGVMIFFDDELLLSIYNKYQLLQNIKPKNAPKNITVLHTNKELEHTMKSAIAYIKNKATNKELLQLKFEEIFLQIALQYKSKNILQYFKHIYSNKIYAFKKSIESNNFYNVQDMINQSNMSEQQFRKVFFDIYGTTPKEWILHNSLKKAEQLLKNTTLNVSQIALECNFNSLSWFVKSFKKQYNITPKQYSKLI
jgi:AraC-like DNA-binding protein